LTHDRGKWRDAELLYTSPFREPTLEVPPISSRWRSDYNC